MNLERLLSVSSFFGPIVVGFVLAGCSAAGFGPRTAATPSDPLVVAEPPPTPETATTTPAAVAATTPAPTLAELAARPEPRRASEVAAIEAELDLLAKQRAESADPAEIAALEARAAELKRLAATAGAGSLRR
jgi:hypothetical protein